MTAVSEIKIKSFLSVDHNDWYDVIKDVDLKGNEYQYHDVCFKKVMNKAYYSDTTTTTVSEEWRKVCDYIDVHVVQENKIVPMSTLLEICGEKKSTTDIV